MEQEIILLFAKPYSIDDNGTIKSGVSFHYIMADSLDPVSDSSTGSLGVQPVKGSLPIEESGCFIKAPARYKAKFVLAASGGKNILKVSKLTYLGELKLNK